MNFRRFREYTVILQPNNKGANNFRTPCMIHYQYRTIRRSQGRFHTVSGTRNGTDSRNAVSSLLLKRHENANVVDIAINGILLDKRLDSRNL